MVQTGCAVNRLIQFRMIITKKKWLNKLPQTTTRSFHNQPSYVQQKLWQFRSDYNSFHTIPSLPSKEDQPGKNRPDKGEMPDIVDDKSEHCIPFILGCLDSHQKQYKDRGERPPPFFIGLNGVQGAGKTTLVSSLRETLHSPPYNLPTVVLSIDDLYLPHDQQKALAASHPENPLIQHRGEPSTHDIETGVRLFDDLTERQPNIKIPSYDKSEFNGAGDRRPENEWATVNSVGETPVEVVIFEGWCVGFRALHDSDVSRKWEDAKTTYETHPERYDGQLGKLQLEHVLFVNDKLREYDALTDRLNTLIHIDASEIHFVYEWRQEQEAAMRKSKGTGLSEEQVYRFINGYYPAYELYTEVLRGGIFDENRGRQLRIVIGRDRRVTEVLQL